MLFSYAIREFLQRERRLRIVILGLENAGKSSILRAWLKEDIREISPTFGYQIFTSEYKKDNETYILDIFDIGGQNSIRAYWETYYSDADGVLFVYDIHAGAAHISTLESTISHPSLSQAVFICAANKSENLPGETKKTEVISYETEKEIGFNYLEDVMEQKSTAAAKKVVLETVYTSAKTGKNIQKVFYMLVEGILEKRKQK